MVKQKNSRCLITLLCMVALVAVGISVWALFFRDDSVLPLDYIPQAEEQNAQAIPNDSGLPADSPSGGGSVSLTYSNEITVDRSDEMASLFFANPGRSNQDMSVQIVIHDEVIAQSGKLRPGYQITEFALLDGAAKRLAVGGYEGKFVILYYAPETGEKAAVNTEIPVTITVQE